MCVPESGRHSSIAQPTSDTPTWNASSCQQHFCRESRPLTIMRAWSATDRGLGTAGSKLLAAAAAKSFLCRGAVTREGDNDGNCLSSDSIPHSHSLHHSSFLPTSGPNNITLKLWYRLLCGTMMNIWINLAYICYCIIALCTDVINSPRYISIFVVLGFICISSLRSRQHQHDCMTHPIRQIGGWRCDHVTRPGHCCVVSYTWP